MSERCESSSGSPDATPEGFDLLYREGPCIVVSKPGGLLTQSAPHIDNLVARIKRYIKELEGKTGKVYLGVPHRLDRPVSGALVVARHVRAAKRLSRQFEQRTVGKRYWAVVEGDVAEPQGVWEDYLRKIPDVAKAEVADAGRPDAKHARLRYRVLRRLKEPQPATLLEIELETGRMHQIRVQAAARGFPILGDSTYGAESAFGPQTDDLRARWIALHARSLAFEHPMTREPVRVTAPLSGWWPKAWETLEE